MPELPEIETMRRHIERSLAGKVLRNLEIRLERVVLWPSGLGPGELEGATLRSARRRAKWLLLEFDNGLSLAVHFGLTGQLFHDGPQGKAMLGHPVPALDVPRPHKSTHADIPLRRRLDSLLHRHSPVWTHSRRPLRRSPGFPRPAQARSGAADR